MFEFIDSLALFLGYIVILVSLLVCFFVLRLILCFIIYKLKEKHRIKKWEIFFKRRLNERALVKIKKELEKDSCEESMDKILKKEKIGRSLE